MFSFPLYKTVKRIMFSPEEEKGAESQDASSEEVPCSSHGSSVETGPTVQLSLPPTGQAGNAGKQLCIIIIYSLGLKEEETLTSSLCGSRHEP